FAHLANTKVDHKIDGHNLAPIWMEGKKGDAQRTLIWVRREGNFRHQGRCYYAIRQGDWKLLQNHPFEPMQLVNLRDDPKEQKPMPASHPQARKLIARLMAHIQKAGNKAWQK
ncbi:MAG: N-acetylgalactosamine 6-sulfate sulfatase, partial [Opitutae bacterium]